MGTKLKTLKPLKTSDFQNIIVSAAITEEDGKFRFTGVSHTSLSKKVSACRGYNFIVSNNQRISPPGSEGVYKVEGLEQLVNFIFQRNEDAAPFRDIAAKLMLSKSLHPELFLTELPSPISMMSPMAWKSFLFGNRDGNKRSAFEYLMKPATEESNQGARLVVLGEPGSGKTYLLNYIAYVCSENYSFVPLLVDLEVYSGDECFVEVLGAGIKTIVDDKLNVSDLVDRGDFLLLVDGLSALPEKSKLFKSLIAFLKRNPRCSAIISCDTNLACNYLEGTGQFQHTIINGLPLKVQSQLAGTELHTSAEKELFSAYQRDSAFVRLSGNPSFFKNILHCVQRCDNPGRHKDYSGRIENFLNYALTGLSIEKTKLEDTLKMLAKNQLEELLGSKPTPFPKDDTSFLNACNLLMEIGLLQRSHADPEQSFQFSTASFFAFFAYKQALNSGDIDKVINIFGFSDIEVLLSVFSSHTLLRELVVILAQQYGYLVDWAEKLLSKETDDFFLHRRTLGIKCVREFPMLLDNQEIKARCEAAANTLLDFWIKAEYFMIEGHLYDAIIDISFVFPDLFKKKVRAAKSNDQKNSIFERVQQFAGRVDIRGIGPVADNPIDEIKLDIKESLILMKLLCLNPDSSEQKAVLDLLGNEEWDLELLDFLGAVKFDDRVLKSLSVYFDQLDQQIKDAKEKNDGNKAKIYLKKVILTCRALGYQNLRTIEAQELVSRMFNMNLPKLTERRFMDWAVIEISQYYDIRSFGFAIVNRLISKLGQFVLDDQLSGDAKLAATRMFAHTKDYDIRSRLASITWHSTAYLPQKPALKLSDAIAFLQNGNALIYVSKYEDISIEIDSLDGLYAEISTRGDYAENDIIYLTRLALSNSSARIVKDLTKLFIVGNMRIRKRILEAFSEAHLQSVGGDTVKCLNESICNTYHKHQTINKDDLQLYVRLTSVTADDNFGKVLGIINSWLDETQCKDPETIVIVQKLILNTFKWDFFDDHDLRGLVENLANSADNDLTLKPFFYQLDKKGYRFNSGESGKIKVDYG